MPNIYNQRYGYENETPVYDDDRYNIPQQELAYGGRAGYETGGDVSEEQSLIEKILEGKINIGAGFGNKNKDDPFNKYGFGERDIKDPRLGIEYTMNPGDERSSKIGISVGPKGGGISFMKPFSEKLNEEKNENVVQTYIDFAKNVWGVEVTAQEARKALGIYDIPDTSIRNKLLPEELAYGGRAGYFLGGAIKKAIGEIGEKFTPEQQEVILKNPSVGKGIGSMIRGALGSIFKKISNNKPQPTPDLSLKLDRPVQSGDPIGSYYANPNNPALASVAPPTTNPLTRPLSMAGFYGSEIFDILKRSGFNFADGGRVSMSEGGLTTTVPPAKGPDSQGVESLFRRRYI
jgi:hypothetical protein